MKIKIEKILQFPTVYEKIKCYRLPIKMAYNFSKINNEVINALNFYKEQYTLIAEKYGEKDESGALIPGEGGRGIKIKPECLDECQNALTELFELEVDLNCELLSLSDLEIIENFTLTANDAEILMPFICV